MGMTIDEIIVTEKEIAEDFKRIVDTHMVSEATSLEELYCDDTEIINEELERCKNAVDYHTTIANIMHKYQKIQEIVNQKDYDRFNSHNYYGYFLRVQDIRKVLEDGKNNNNNKV